MVLNRVLDIIILYDYLYGLFLGFEQKLILGVVLDAYDEKCILLKKFRFFED